jgi:hypothetical protein
VHFDLPPIAGVADVAKAMAAITAAVAEGAITPVRPRWRRWSTLCPGDRGERFDQRLKVLEAAHAADL